MKTGLILSKITIVDDTANSMSVNTQGKKSPNPGENTKRKIKNAFSDRSALRSNFEKKIKYITTQTEKSSTAKAENSIKPSIPKSAKLRTAQLAKFAAWSYLVAMNKGS